MIFEPKSKIKLFITDIDGTLTDGTYFVHSELPNYGRSFNTRDFVGMMLLHNAGIHISAITTAKNAMFEQFERVGGYVEVIAGVWDKLACVKERFVDTGEYNWDEIAFIGDDINDLTLLREVGVAACPADAADVVKAAVLSKDDGDGYALLTNGGRGAVREFADIIRQFEGIPAVWEAPREV